MNEEQYEKTINKFSITGWIGILLSCILLVDSWLPLIKSEENIQKLIVYSSQRGSNFHVGIETSMGRTVLDPDLFSILKEDSTIGIEKTAILGIPVTFYYQGSIYSKANATYTWHKLLPIGLLGISIFCLYSKQRYFEFTFIIAAFVVSLIILILFVMMSDIYLASS